MKIMTAIDSFKGSASSKELGQAIKKELEKNQQLSVINVPIADGGEGSLAAIYESKGGSWRNCWVHDLLFRKRKVSYLVLEHQQEKHAFIESASVVGLDLIRPSSETVRRGSSFGLGELLLDAVQQGIQNITLFLGGTGTIDGGLGLLQALGAAFYTCEGHELPSNTNLLFEAADMKWAAAERQTFTAHLTIAADVTNPYFGEKGAFHIFGPQKGATFQQIDLLDQQARQLSQRVSRKYGIAMQQEGAGAAGGIAGACLLLGGQMISGFDIISHWVDLRQILSKVDLVFTGEGSLDQQTNQGKVPWKVAQLAAEYQKPVVALCGRKAADLGALDQLLTASFCIQREAVALEKAMTKTYTLENIAITSHQIIKLWFYQPSPS
jgi:glycerate kinase